MTSTTSEGSQAPFALIILDGYGHNPRAEGNAISQATKPTLDRLYAACPQTELITFGERVGLPDGQMGNSEVGHLNIGAGRVVEQDLERINRIVREHKLLTLPTFAKLAHQFDQSQVDAASKAIHIIGLASTGGVHSSLVHFKELIFQSLQFSRQVFVHAITDGRDRPPTAALDDVRSLISFINQTEVNGRKAQLASVIGRYFAMDRDKRWERTNKAYQLYVKGVGTLVRDPIAAIEASHQNGVFDEFLEPMRLDQKLDPETADARAPLIQSGDIVLCANFRADRMRQIVSAFLGSRVNFDGFPTEPSADPVGIYTLTEYDSTFPVEVIFPQQLLTHTLGQIIADHGMTQLRIAETEKYPHVTYFFNGGFETPFPGESRIIVPSPRDVATYDLKPEMSAETVASNACEFLRTHRPNLMVLNFANCDMVGHTGDLAAATAAVEVVDRCLGQVLDCIAELRGQAIVTADHGNADQMIDYETRQPHTFHTTYPVPLLLVGAPKEVELRANGALCDIAPTILELLHLPQPSEMTGRSLLVPSMS